MKKLISLFMVLAIVCLFGGCKSEVKEDVSSDNPVEAEENVEEAANDENTPSATSNAVSYTHLTLPTTPYV